MSQNSFDAELSSFIHNLRAALPYLEEFDQKTFVIYLSGELIKIQNSRVIKDLALLISMPVNDLIIIHKMKIFLLKKKIYRLLNRQSLLPTGSCYQGSRAVLANCKLLPGISYQLRKKTFQTIMIPTLPEVFAVLTLKL